MRILFSRKKKDDPYSTHDTCASCSWATHPFIKAKKGEEGREKKKKRAKCTFDTHPNTARSLKSPFSVRVSQWLITTLRLKQKLTLPKITILSDKVEIIPIMEEEFKNYCVPEFISSSLYPLTRSTHGNKHSWRDILPFSAVLFTDWSSTSLFQLVGGHD